MPAAVEVELGIGAADDTGAVGGVVAGAVVAGAVVAGGCEVGLAECAPELHAPQAMIAVAARIQRHRLTDAHYGDAARHELSERGISTRKSSWAVAQVAASGKLRTATVMLSSSTTISMPGLVDGVPAARRVSGAPD
jgi:hypothetical protein